MLAFHAVQPPNTEMELTCSLHSMKQTPMADPEPPIASSQDNADAEAHAAAAASATAASEARAEEARPTACYEVRGETGPGHVRLTSLPWTTSTWGCGNGREEKPTKKKGSKKRKKTSQEEPLPEVKFTLTGFAFALE